MNADTQTRAEAEVRAVLDSWLKAVRTGDVAAITANYHPDSVAFDAVSALQFKGVEAYVKHWRSCMETVPAGTMVFEVHQAVIAADGDVAFCHGLTRCGVIAPDGTEQLGWTRMTQCYRRSSGRWRIVHEHFSAPFDMETMTMLLDLEP